MGENIMSSHQDSRAGAKTYTPAVLFFYDFLVFKFNGPILWGVTTKHLLGLYNQHISEDHLDIGVGTGYFLDKCIFPGASPRICLMDLNESSLRHTAKRISRYHPKTVVGDALLPLPFEDNRFGSIGMNSLLHCMPGDLSKKSVVFDHAARCLIPGGVVFGATVLNIQDKMNWLAKRVFSDFNKKGIFCNQEDSLETLESELSRRFDDVRISMKGVAALFSGKRRVDPNKNV